MYSPQTLRRGNSLRSSNKTDQPARANSNPAVAPAGPPPITTASYVFVKVVAVLLSGRAAEFHRLRGARVEFLSANGMTMERASDPSSATRLESQGNCASEWTLGLTRFSGDFRS